MVHSKISTHIPISEYYELEKPDQFEVLIRKLSEILENKNNIPNVHLSLSHWLEEHYYYMSTEELEDRKAKGLFRALGRIRYDGSNSGPYRPSLEHNRPSFTPKKVFIPNTSRTNLLTVCVTILQTEVDQKLVRELFQDCNVKIEPSPNGWLGLRLNFGRASPRTIEVSQTRVYPTQTFMDLYKQVAQYSDVSTQEFYFFLLNGYIDSNRHYSKYNPKKLPSFKNLTSTGTFTYEELENLEEVYEPLTVDYNSRTEWNPTISINIPSRELSLDNIDTIVAFVQSL